MIDAFVLRAVFGACGVAALCAVLGTTLIWRRMAFLGDGLAHGALVGVALAFWVAAPPFVGVVAVGVALAFLLSHWASRDHSNDAVLLLISQSLLALGIVLMHTDPSLRVRFAGFLYGDVLSLNAQHLVWIYAAMLGVFLALSVLWRSLLCMTLDPAMAQVHGHRVVWVRHAHSVLLAVGCAVAIQLVGALLVSALLVVPALTVRPWVKTPWGHVVAAGCLGVVTVGLGFPLAIAMDWPVGPSVVLAGSGLFVLSRGLPHP